MCMLSSYHTTVLQTWPFLCHFESVCCSYKEFCCIFYFGWSSEINSNCVLTLYSIDTHFDAWTTDSFWKLCRKRRNCSKQAISSFPTTFSTESDNCIPIFLYFWHHIFYCCWTERVQNWHRRYRVKAYHTKWATTFFKDQEITCSEFKMKWKWWVLVSNGPWLKRPPTLKRNSGT